MHMVEPENLETILLPPWQVSILCYFLFFILAVCSLKKPGHLSFWHTGWVLQITFHVLFNMFLQIA